MEIQIRHQLCKIVDLTEKDLQAFLSISTYQKMKAGELIEQSKFAGRRSLFIINGTFRMFYVNEKGLELTTHFFLEPDFITNCDKFLSKIQEDLHIQAVQESEILVFNNDDLAELYDLYPNFKEIEAYTVRSILNETIKHKFLLQNKDPDEKYRLLLIQRPGIDSRVSVTHLASYLGLARETLSRVRAKVF